MQKHIRHDIECKLCKHSFTVTEKNIDSLTKFKQSKPSQTIVLIACPRCDAIITLAFGKGGYYG